MKISQFHNFKFKLLLNITLLIIILNISSINTQDIKLIKTVDEIENSVSIVPRNLQVKLSDDEIRSIFRNASLSMGILNHRQRSMNANKQFTNILHGHGSKGTKETKNIQDLTKIALTAARTIINMKGYDKNKYALLSNYKAPNEYCPYVKKPFCDYTYRYRTIDGSCNNKQNPWWGMKDTPFKRILPPVYEDGINYPREKSVTGRKLPNARLIAIQVHHSNDINSHVTNMFPHMGQFIDHDITLTASTSDDEGSAIKCFCDTRDIDCFNIAIPKEDRFNKDQRCIVTPRSAPAFKKFGCNLGYREQLNQITHWLDLSQTYGNDLKTNLELRLRYAGLLNSSVIKGMKRDYLPFTQDDKCANINDGEPCFSAGDIRVNQNSILMGFQTAWLREHNRVALILGKLNPHWNDEKLFQETRRIVTAVYQHIIYNEFIPVFIGNKAVLIYGLKPLNQGYFNRYDPKLNPSILNEFSTAAMRMGHTLVRGSFLKVDQNYRIFENSTLKTIIFNPLTAFKRGGLDSYIRGCAIEPSHKYDPNINDGLNHHLFEGLKDFPSKRASLPMFNIQRGRDHALQGYNYYRALCGLNYARNFDELYNIPKRVRDDLKKIYDHVNDIDLFTGGISELPIEGGVVGPTFACIVAKQFRDLKYADRFYYENGHDPLTRFNPYQLEEIRKASFSRLLCDNIEINFIQKNPFLKHNFQTNPYISCDNYPQVDYKFWQEKPYHH